jgi:hypothetical protein
MTAAPLYITVGPPCAGKTTWVRRMQQTQQQQQESSSAGLSKNGNRNNKAATMTTIHDVTIDDQPGVYVPLPTSWYLSRHNKKNSSDGRGDDDAAARRFIVHGKSAYDRIQDQVELCTILARLSNQISRDECTAKLLSVNNNNGIYNNDTVVSSTRGILAAVEEYMESTTTTTTTGSTSSDEPTSRTMTKIQLPETIDLFVVEALFPDRPAGNNNNNNNNNKNHHQHHPSASKSTGAIAKAGQVLRDQPIADTIVWGNTNCRCTDYRDALQLAERQGRPVHFVVYQEGDSAEFDGPDDDDDDNDDGTTRTTVPTAGQQQHQLHAKDLQQLFRRSIVRLVQTGRYVPSAVIYDMRRRCLELQIMTESTTTTNHNNGTAAVMTTGVALECHLARLAQYELDPTTRLVRALSTKRRLSNDPQQRGGGRSIHHHPSRTAGGGQLREPWRGGLLYDTNRYGNYSATNNSTGGNTSTTRGGGGGRSSREGGGGRSLWNAGDRTHEQHRGGGGRWSGR